MFKNEGTHRLCGHFPYSLFLVTHRRLSQRVRYAHRIQIDTALGNVCAPLKLLFREPGRPLKVETGGDRGIFQLLSPPGKFKISFSRVIFSGPKESLK